MLTKMMSLHLIHTEW